MKTVRTRYGPGHCVFTVWAPGKDRMILHIVSPFDGEYEMEKDDEGYFSVRVETDKRPLRYYYKPGAERDYPDPASHYQPEGVHGPSEVVDHDAFRWTDQAWKGIPFEELVFYELHTGTFTPEGTFGAIIPRLGELAETGINAIELMPVSQFPGSRNWGYDGVYLYSVQNSYGGPDELKRLVDACHSKGIAVFLDVVYNHLGPEGNYFGRFGPYFTHHYRTPWGDALNYDGAWSDGVRDYFSDNALFWMEHYHIDGLRIDAIHTIIDNSAVHFWAMLSGRVAAWEKKLGRHLHLVAESDLNSPHVVKTPVFGGYGFRAQWLDDFHHALYVLLDPSGRERYYDFGAMKQLAKAYTDGFVLSGDFVKFRRKKYGASSAGIPGDRFVVFNQNHDQVGNRVDGKRLSLLTGFENLKVAAAAVMLAPYVPLLFMGEEYGDETPFWYFVDHSDPQLVRAVQEGRKKEFANLGFTHYPPDPQDMKTFRGSIIQWDKRHEGRHGILLRWHRELIRLRRGLAPLKNYSKQDVEVELLGEDGFVLLRKWRNERLICLFNLTCRELTYTFPRETKPGLKVLDSKDNRWMQEPLYEDRLLPESPQAGETVAILPFSVTVYHHRQEKGDTSGGPLSTDVADAW